MSEDMAAIVLQTTRYFTLLSMTELIEIETPIPMEDNSWK